MSYVLITAAHNEEAYIETTIRAVVRQTVLPSRWIIVSDGSADGTESIVSGYAADFSFIELLRIPDRHGRCFASKVFALNAGAASLAADEYAYIGHLDADVSFESNYFCTLMERFQSDVKLGLAGGSVYESAAGKFKPRRTNSVRSVAGAVQMFRRECYESIGGFCALPWGGEDWHAEVTARMNGWRVMGFRDLEVHHLRPTGTAGNHLIGAWYRLGRMDYCLGSHPVFEVLKIIRRLREKPLIVGAAVRLWAFMLGHLRREKRLVSSEFVKFLQAEQMARLWPFGDNNAR